MDDDTTVPSYPWSWRSALFIVLDATSAGLVITGRALFDLAGQVAADHNYQVDRRKFAEQAALEIESMTNGE